MYSCLARCTVAAKPYVDEIVPINLRTYQDLAQIK